jgi:hypothetical protein
MAAGALATISYEPSDVTGERDRRLELWTMLQGQPSQLHAASLLNELRIFYGGRGIWVHQEITRGIAGSTTGVTVGLLHTGSAYADDLHEDGVIYHYPRTSVPGRDQAEIDATKAAMRLKLPVFVVSYPFRKAPTRRVHLGWVDDFDDNQRWFLVSFREHQDPVFSPAEELPFVPITSKPQKLQVTTAR